MHFQIETDIALLGYAIQLESRHDMKPPTRSNRKTKTTTQPAGQSRQLAKLR